MNLQDCRKLARDLVLTGELDPIYTMLYRARGPKGDNWVARFCMHFLMFYNAKEAYKAAYYKHFWDDTMANYGNTERGKERRHFRGPTGLRSIRSLNILGKPEWVFFMLAGRHGLPRMAQILRDNEVRGFGAYFLVKWADLLCNVFNEPINFKDLPDMLPEPPAKCLSEIFPDLTARQAMDVIVSWVADLDDPFSGTRKCGYSEAETIACAIPTYLLRPRYKMGDDILKYKKQLADCPELLDLLP